MNICTFAASTDLILAPLRRCLGEWKRPLTSSCRNIFQKVQNLRLSLSGSQWAFLIGLTYTQAALSEVQAQGIPDKHDPCQHLHS